MNLRAKLEQCLHRHWSKRGLFSQFLRPLSAIVTWYTQKKAQQPRVQLSIKAPLLSL